MTRDRWELIDAMSVVFSPDEDEIAEISKEYAALDIQWHCEGRHGVVRDIPEGKAARVQQVIEFYQGRRSCYWAHTGNEPRSVEFVSTTKTFPPPRKPWQWCGTTVLFSDWQGQEEDLIMRAKTFWRGQRVEFTHRRRRKAGTVIRVNTYGITVAGDDGQRYGVKADAATPVYDKHRND